MRPGALPTFLLTTEQGEALQLADWTTLDERHIVMPFNEFAVSFEQPIRRILSDRGVQKISELFVSEGSRLPQHVQSAAGFESAREPRVARIEVSVHDERRFVASCHVLAKDWPYSGQFDGALRLLCDIDQRECYPIPNTNGEALTYDGKPLEEIVIYGELSAIGPRRSITCGSGIHERDVVMAARFVISFLLMLNNRETRAVYGVAPTRQQRRNAERTGERVEQRIYVYIPRERVEKAVCATNRGVKTYARAAHTVRGSLRHLASGRVTPVRAHHRGGKPTSIPIYDARALEPQTASR